MKSQRFLNMTALLWQIIQWIGLLALVLWFFIPGCSTVEQLQEVPLEFRGKFIQTSENIMSGDVMPDTLIIGSNNLKRSIYIAEDEQYHTSFDTISLAIMVSSRLTNGRNIGLHRKNRKNSGFEIEYGPNGHLYLVETDFDDNYVLLGEYIKVQ